MTTPSDDIGKGGGGPRGPRGPRGGGRRGGLRRGGHTHHYGPGGVVLYDNPLLVYDAEPVEAELLPPVPALLRAAEAEGQKKGWAKAMMSAIGERVTAFTDDMAALDEEFDLLDADTLVGDGSSGGGFFGDALSSVLSVASKAAETGVSIYQKDQARKAQSAADQQKLSTAQKADQQAVAAAVRAELSAKAAAAAPKDAGKQAEAQTDAQTAATLAQAQSQAGAGLSEEGQAARMQAAQQALQAATDALDKQPGNAAAIARVNAWNKAMNRLNSASIVAPQGQGQAAAAPEPSWLSGKTGPVPNKVLAGGGAVVAAVLVLRAALK